MTDRETGPGPERVRCMTAVPEREMVEVEIEVTERS